MRNESRAERLREAARTGLGRSPPAGVCRLTDSSALVYHTAAANGEGVLSWQKHTHPACRPSSAKCTPDVCIEDENLINVQHFFKSSLTIQERLSSEYSRDKLKIEPCL